jgi:predicted CXXCH cytochrome family protein
MIHELDEPAFQNVALRAPSGVESVARMVDGSYQILAPGRSNDVETFTPEMAIGLDPLVQYLVPFEGGRFQTLALSYDPKNKTWFDVFGDEERQGHEWGFWANQGMNWNVQCAFCHMTGYVKGYDETTDTYHSTWDDMGISCSQCHGDMAGHPSSETEVGSYKVPMDSCAVCHARREQLTDGYPPGARFDDHFRLALPGNPALYHPNGKLIEEVYVYGSFLMNRMSHAGVTCVDCHDPHTAELKYPASNNTLCLSCHAAPGVQGAIPIVPTEHSHHGFDSPGNVCIDCHMPHDTFMQVDARRDHAFLNPDPVLTRDLGIPNACATCHQDQSNDWLIDAVDAWYGTNMNQRVRVRTRAIAAAQRQEADAWPDLLAVAKEEEIPIWRATCASLLTPYTQHAEVNRFLLKELKHEASLVREASARALAGLELYEPSIRGLLNDPVRSVRLSAADVLAERLPDTHPAMQELETFLQMNSDQPQGLVTRAQTALRRGSFEDGLDFLQKALRMDGESAYIHYLEGMALHRLGRLDAAAESLARAIDREEGNIDYRYSQALLAGERNQPEEALDQLKKIVDLDPSVVRAWYNLGLAYAQLERLPEAVEALTSANTLQPMADTYYAQATILLRQGKQEEAVNAAEAALQLDPNHRPSQDLLQQSI